VVGAKGFEPSTSWSRTRESKILKSCRCRTYAPNKLQNLPSIGPHGTQTGDVIGGRSPHCRAARAISPPLARIQLLQPLLSGNDLYKKVERMVCLSDRSDFKAGRNYCAAQCRGQPSKD
jgi:hypothetical protein